MEFSWTEIAVAITAILGVVFAVWRHVASKIESNKNAIHAHQVHVAETYVTKAGMHEQTAQIMTGVREVGDGISRLNERIDRVIERQDAVNAAKVAAS